MTWQCRKIRPGSCLCPTSLLSPLPALTHPRRVFVLTQEDNPAPTSKLHPYLSQTAAPWHQSPWCRRGTKGLVGMPAGSCTSMPEEECMAGGGPQRASEAQGPELWLPHLTQGQFWSLHIFTFLTSAFPGENNPSNQLPHRYETSQSSYFIIKLHSIITEL